MEKWEYSGRVFRVREFEFIDYDIGIAPTPSYATLKTGERVWIVPHPNGLSGIWAEITRGERKSDEKRSV